MEQKDDNEKLKDIIDSVCEICEKPAESDENTEVAQESAEPVATEEEVFECPECGARITEDMTVCPNCGVELSFEYEDEE